jgi:hypothetical protein
MRKHFAVVILFGILFATQGFGQYKDYPQIAGKVQPLEEANFPAWMTLDMDLRGRTEAQTAINYLSGNAQVYELTRARGGMQLRPSKAARTGTTADPGFHAGSGGGHCHGNCFDQSKHRGEEGERIGRSR